jgi:hypothetical protein
VSFITDLNYRFEYCNKHSHGRLLKAVKSKKNVRLLLLVAKVNNAKIEIAGKGEIQMLKMCVHLISTTMFILIILMISTTRIVALSRQIPFLRKECFRQPNIKEYPVNASSYNSK